MAEDQGFGWLRLEQGTTKGLIQLPIHNDKRNEMVFVSQDNRNGRGDHHRSECRLSDLCVSTSVTEFEWTSWTMQECQPRHHSLINGMPHDCDSTVSTADTALTETCHTFDYGELGASFDDLLRDFLDAALHQLSEVEDKAPGEQGSSKVYLSLDETLFKKIGEQIRGHRSSIEFLFQCLQRQSPAHLRLEEPPYALELEQLERRSSDAKLFRNLKLEGKFSEQCSDASVESIFTLESTETALRIKKEHLIAPRHEERKPNSCLEVVEKSSHSTREQTEWTIRIELAERHFQFELRDSRPYRRAEFSSHKQTEEFGLVVPVPSPSNLTTTTDAGRMPRSKHQAPGYGHKRNQTYENSHSSSTADRICSILELIESRLNLAIAKQDFQAVSETLETGADPNALHATAVATKVWSYPEPIPALIHASIVGNHQIVSLLLERGATNEACLGDKKNALICASIEGHTEVVKLLLAHGASAKQKDDAGRTPILHAAWHGHEDVVNLLSEKGADFNMHSLMHRETPMNEVTYKGHVSVVEMLLRRNASIFRAVNPFTRPPALVKLTSQNTWMVKDRRLAP
ncbi:hypothetical protein EG329_009943 [Mollisiaceae sp. DMI_Dod_QoI]|nr:hypothetical protein EG329_009943 [Helotiales sp. DMI_Dod_QoI]